MSKQREAAAILALELEVTQQRRRADNAERAGLDWMGEALSQRSRADRLEGLLTEANYLIEQREHGERPIA